ncbi:MAG: hypothetical protein JWQ07_4054 [Ramlibacter sp.]|nr:hypothetical protein [Ramlibacter sp.]
MAGLDLRGFDYALESVRTQRRWQLDAELVRLGDLKRRLAECCATRDDLNRQSELQAEEAAHAWQSRRDPASHARLLGYLASLHQRRSEVEVDIHALTESVRETHRQCARKQTRVQVLDEHRTASQKAYVLQLQRKIDAEADRDWSARSTSRETAKDFK